MRYSLVKLLLFLAGVAATVRAQPLTNVVIQPPCSINFNISVGGATSAVLNNLTGACTNWTISYSSTGFSAISLLVQDAPDNGGAPGTWVTFGGTVVSGSNPNTTTTSATTVLAGYYPWMRVILSSKTGTGKVSGTLYGYLNTASTSSGSPPTGPAGGDLAGTYPNPTVVGINGTNLAGLGTGIAKLTAGVPSLAASADVIALWTGTCNSSSFLNGAGACTAPSSTPAFSSITSGTNTTAAMLVGVGASLNYNYTGAAAPTLPTNTNMYLIGALASSSRVANVAFGGTAFHTDIRFDGTPDSSTAVASGEQIGGYNAFGYDGTALGGPLASVRIFANQNFAVGAHGTYVDITTTPNGSATAAAVIRFENDAGITVPSTVTGGDKGAGTINATGLYVNGTAVSTTTGTVTSVATNNGLTGGTITTTGTIGLASVAANTVLGALTATFPSAQAVPSCSTATSALTWTSGMGFGCNTITPGTGTVTSIATTAPLAGGTITTTGTLSITGAAGQVLAGSAPAFTATPTLGVNGTTTGQLLLATSTGSGASTTITPSGITVAATITLPPTTTTLPGLALNNVFTANGALSSGNGPGATFNGTWVASGSATTTKPYVLVEPTSTTSTGWQTTGTGLGINAASGFSGYLIDAQVAGSSKFSVTSAGLINAAGLTMGAVANVITANTYKTIGSTFGMGLEGTMSTTAYFVVQAINSSSFAPTTGSSGMVQSGSTNAFNPASGTATYTGFNQIQTVNQTSTATGITRGFYDTPVLTSAYDYRAIEVQAYTDNVLGNHTTAQAVLLGAVTYASGSAATLTNAVTLLVNPPIQGTNETINNLYGIWNTGAEKVDGSFILTNGAGAANTVACWKANAVMGWASNTAGTVGTTCN